MWSLVSEAYSEPSQRYKMELFAKIVNSWIPLTAFAKNFILVVRLGSEYSFEFLVKRSVRIDHMSQTILNCFQNTTSP